jgi:hypothetical protein
MYKKDALPVLASARTPPTPLELFEEVELELVLPPLFDLHVYVLFFAKYGSSFKPQAFPLGTKYQPIFL